MKARSICPANSLLSNEWVEESWTVDCICGVNFDDGEEMVNCDECGVWVHTRCSQYVKGEASFVCEKCKSDSWNDSEENEVAQLLAELPTKAMEAGNVYSLKNPCRHPVRLENNVPKEERAHVQGIPGGEASFFSSCSSIFTRELWKSTGYVPKKFKFQYKEFPFLDEKPEPSDKSIDESNAVNSGADNLYTSSKHTMHAMNLNGGGKNINQTAELSCQMKICTSKMNEAENDVDFDLMQDDEKAVEECVPTFIDLNKHNKEDMVICEGWHDKRARVLCHETDVKKGPSQNHSTELLEPHCNKMQPQLEVCRNDGPLSIKSDIQNQKDQILEGNCIDMRSSDGLSGVESAVIEVLGSDCNLTNKEQLKNENYVEEGAQGESDHLISTVINDSNYIADMALPLEENDIRDTLKSQEGVCMAIDVFCGNGRQYGPENIKCSPDSKGRESFESTNSICAIPSAIKIGVESDNDRHQGNEFVSQYFQPLKSGDQHFEDIEVSSPMNSRSFNNESENLVIQRDLTKDSEFNTGHGNCYPGEGCFSDTRAEASAPIEEDASDPKSPSFSSYEDMSCDDPTSLAKSGLVSDFSADVENVGGKMPVITRGPVNKGVNYYSISYARTGCSRKISDTYVRKSKVQVVSEENAPLLSQGCIEFSHPGIPSPRTNYSIKAKSASASYSPMSLSDEELALLLHQELNSSPRVPRVPRLRRAGSSPHLTSPSSTSILKCASISERNYHRVLQRTKCALDDSPDPGREIEGKIGSSTDLRQKAVEVSRASNSSSINNQALSSPPSDTANDSAVATERTFSSHQTLPGLIGEILSSGNHMSCEQLCNAVLLQWKMLRKHDGGRYAYSSLPRAVLDCLRSRSEWLELVDCGLKTNQSKRNRGMNPEQPNCAATSGFKHRGQRLKDVEMNLRPLQEDFPKRKRKTRQRRLPSLQEGIENGRKGQPIDVQYGGGNDDSIGSSNSEEILSCEDDSRCQTRSPKTFDV